MPIFRLNPIFLSLFCLMSTSAFSDEALSGLKLQKNLIPSKSDSEDVPIFMKADRMQGHQEQDLEAFGNVDLRTRDQSITADWLRYLKDIDQVEARGNVRVEQAGNIIWGPTLQLKIRDNLGFMDKPDYWLSENHSRGSADILNFVGKGKYQMQQAIYTTCAVGNDDWLLRVSELDIDRNDMVGTAHGAIVEFKDVPILYFPWLNFPIGNQRRSGFMAPVFGSTVKGGAELTLPYYWNIAPNYDATIAPRLMSKRGLMLDNEFRYLFPGSYGEAHLNVLPGDAITKTTRSEMILKHQQNFGYGLTGGLSMQRVSDNNYYRDLATLVGSTSQTNLLRDAYLNYSGGWWNFLSRVQRFQTLQDPLAPVGVPYYRTPQLLLTAQKNDVSGADFAFKGEFTDFSHPTAVNGQRLILNPSVSYPITTASSYVTPKIGLHSTSYTMGANNVGNLPNSTRNVPIFSTDSGVYFERGREFAGNNFIQTLEPRLFYVYIPYRDQNAMPNYDSAPTDFSFAQLFTENQFAGNDRIADANELTFALTSRFIEEKTGAERLRMAIGQRLYLTSPRIIPTNTSKSDLLASIGGTVTDKLRFSTDFQYDPNQSSTKKINFTARYQPEIGKVINLGYRFNRNVLEQFDISAQSRLYGRWHGVARWNYSLFDKKLLEGIVGVEYVADCWAFSIVSKRFATATQQMASAIFVQLELSGLAKVGSDPLESLRRSIPGYVDPNRIGAASASQGATLP